MMHHKNHVIKESSTMSKQYFSYLLSWDICFLLFAIYCIEVISLKLIEPYNFRVLIFKNVYLMGKIEEEV